MQLPMPSKAQMRAQVRKRRRAGLYSGEEGWTRQAADVARLRPQALCIGAYLAAPGEPNLSGAIAAWHLLGLHVLLPVAKPERRLEWVRWTPSTKIGQSQQAPVPEPLDAVPADPHDLDIVVVPALGIGADGTRLGQGGGFYDSFLASAANVVTVGCVHEDEVRDSVPSDPWDAVMDYVWTPSQIRRLPL